MIKLNRLNDKILLSVAAILFAVLLNTDKLVITTAFLLSITISSVSQYTSKKSLFYGINMIVLILSFINPAFYLFLSLSSYEIAFSEKKYVKYILPLFSIISLLSNKLSFGITAILLNIIAVVIAEKTKALEYSKEKLISIRDSSEENKQLLLEKNKILSIGKEQEIKVAVLSERNRIAREIHDNVGHILSRTLLQMGALRVINKDKMLEPHLEQINDSLNAAMTSMRESVHNLHDDSISFEQAVNEIIKPLNDKFSVLLDMDISKNISKKQATCLIGIMKESVSNIIKHSNGNSAVIILREHPAFYQATIEDNGNNDITEINSDGIGLENMKNRAEDIGGVFKYSMEKNKFKVFVSIPKER